MDAARLTFDQQAVVPGSWERVWAILNDPKLVVSCLPGAEITRVDDDGVLRGSLVTKLGPTTVTFQGTVVVEFDRDQRRATLRARGGDAGGRTKASVTITCSLDGDGGADRTTIHIETAVNVSGGLAGFARTGGVHLARRMLDDFEANLGQLTATSEQTAGGEVLVPHRSPAKVDAGRLLLRVLVDVLGGLFTRITGRRKSKEQEERAPS